VLVLVSALGVCVHSCSSAYRLVSAVCTSASVRSEKAEEKGGRIRRQTDAWRREEGGGGRV
jgi:hypothetical protein